MLVSRDVLNHDNFLAEEFVSGAFLQGTIWKDFLEAQKKAVWQLTVTRDAGDVLAVCVLYENKLWFGKSYLYAPKGPVFSNNLTEDEKQEALSLILSQIRDITIATHQYEEIFCKLEPSQKTPTPPELHNDVMIQPQDTLILDLGKDVQQLLAEMHPKTRYNIALANKKGVKIRVGQRKEDVKHFLRLINKTASRQQISAHPENYYKLLWGSLLKNKSGKIYLAEIDGRVVAANMMIEFGNVATYLHGASDYSFRKFMAPHLLQWQAIKDAKENNFEIYDFWGIAPSDGSKPKWEGFTRFKKGFGGREINSPGTKIFVYNRQWYNFYVLAKKIKSIIKK
jgi:lipid II:glycine glycyltransferase (peptidoglycan interpeptide bridge formation enzyme)